MKRRNMTRRIEDGEDSGGWSRRKRIYPLNINQKPYHFCVSRSLPRLLCLSSASLWSRLLINTRTRRHRSISGARSRLISCCGHLWRALSITLARATHPRNSSPFLSRPISLYCHSISASSSFGWGSHCVHVCVGMFDLLAALFDVCVRLFGVCVWLFDVCAWPFDGCVCLMFG